MALTAEQTAKRRAAYTIGQRFGVGGSSWSYYAPSSADNVTAAATLTLTGTRTLYIVREQLTREAIAAAGAPVGDTRWRLIAPEGTSIAAGGVVKSVADTSLVYSIGPLDSDQGFVTAIVEPTVSP